MFPLVKGDRSVRARALPSGDNASLPFYVYFDMNKSHRIGGNREHKIFNNFSFSIAKNVFDCQNRYYSNRKRLISSFWQIKLL